MGVFRGLSRRGYCLSGFKGGWRILDRCVILTHSLLIRTLTNRTRYSLGCSVLSRLSMLDSYDCVGCVLCNGMNEKICVSLYQEERDISLHILIKTYNCI